MKYSVDNFIKIGSSHKLCEDYSLCGMIGDIPYIIVSDGCSSSKHTDVGARILCHTAVDVLKRNSNDLQKLTYKCLGELILDDALPIARSLSLPKTALDATLLISYVVNGECICCMYGDGTYIINDSKEQTKTLIEVSYESNAPLYLSYSDSQCAMEKYLKIFDGCKRIETIIDLGTLSAISESRDVQDALAIVTAFSEGDFILLTTDGIDTFVSPAGETKSTVVLAKDLIDFKGYNGEFVRRRTQRVLKNLAVENITNIDDFTIAGIYMESDSNETIKDIG